jgi:hypothetical protein
MVDIDIGISGFGRAVFKIAISGVVFHFYPEFLWAKELEARRSDVYKVRT